MQRIFLSWARPAAPAFAAAVYAVVYAVNREPRVLHIILILLASVVAGVLYRLAARRFSADAVIRVALPVDTLIIASMTVALGRPGLLAIAYFWSIALAALLLGPRETLGNTLLAMVCAGAVPYIADVHRVDPVVPVTDVLVMALVGGLLSLLPLSVERAERALEQRARVDAAALAISERIRSTLDFHEIIGYALDEMRRATGSARAVLRLIGDDGGLFQNTREGVGPLPQAPSVIQRTIERTRRPLVVHGPSEVTDPELREHMGRHDMQALIAYPILDRGRVVGAIGLQDDEPRAWEDAVPLLDRIVPQLQAALQQARLFASQREAVERLEELARLREELVANVSHELRTPLTATMGFLRTVLRPDTDFPPEQRDEFLRLALEQAERLAALVNDLLELTRLERGALPLNAEPTDVAEVVGAACEHVPAKPALELEPGLVANVDRARLEQVLENLITNAFRHGRGSVEVRGRRADGRVVVEVTDDGEIPPDVVPHLFVPFARWSSSEGSGLGLAIARSLVEAHGGRLVYRPAGDGSRHAFVVELPAA